MTLGELRNELGKDYPTDELLEEFVLESFPKIFRNFSRGMSRTEKENYLLASVDPDVLHERLEEFRKNKDISDASLFSVHLGGKAPKKTKGSRARLLKKKFKQIVYVDALLNIVSSVLEWVAEKLGIEKKEAERFKNLHSLYAIILLLAIITFTLRRWFS